MNGKALITAFLLGFSGAQVALACEFHGAGFGPYGSHYKPYYGDTQQNYDAEQLSEWASNQLETEAQRKERKLFERRPVTRPSFSNAAARAAKTAKERIGQTKFQKSIGLGVLDQNTIASNANR